MMHYGSEYIFSVLSLFLASSIFKSNPTSMILCLCNVIVIDQIKYFFFIKSFLSLCSQCCYGQCYAILLNR